MTLTSKTVATLLSKLYTALSHIDLNEGGAMGGLMLDYKMTTRTISVRVNGKWMPLLSVPADADLNAYAADGRKTWRSIKALVAVVEAKQEELTSLCVEELLTCEVEDLKDVMLEEGWNDLPALAHLVTTEDQAAYQVALTIWHTITQADWDEQAALRIQRRLTTEAEWAARNSRN